MKNLKLIIISLLLLIIHIHLASADAGDSGLYTICIPMTAREYGMGNTGVSIADGVGSIFNNPAGLVKIDSSEIGFSYHSSLFDVILASGQYAFHFKNTSDRIAFSLQSINSGNVDLNYLDGSTRTIVGESTAILTGAYARNLVKHINIGINLKVINNQFLDQEDVYAFATDIGLITKDYKIIEAGLSVCNLGSKIQYLNKSYSLPFTIKFGLSKTFNLKKDTQLTLASQIERIEDLFIFNFGLESDIMEYLILRTGCQVQNENVMLTFGGGINIKNYILDYALTPDIFGNSLGSRYCISFKIEL